MKGFVRACYLVAVLCTLTVPPLRAQAPFSSISIGGVVGQEVSQGRFQERWDTGASAGLSLRMPFHVGEMGLGFSVARNSRNDPRYPHFTSALIHVGWGPALNVSSRLHARLLLLAGDYFMAFDEDGPGYSRRENELLLGASGGLSYFFSGPIAVFTRISFFRIYTSVPIEFIQIAGGVEVRLPVSARIRSLLR